MTQRIERQPRGLFVRTRELIPLENTAEAKAWFAKQRYGADLVDDSIGVIRGAAERALLDAGLSVDTDPAPNLEGNAALAADVLMNLRLLNEARNQGRMEDAIHCAMKATEYWMQLRANVFFEEPVREKERRQRHAARLSDADIESAVACEPTLKDAASRLGISERQLRTRRKAIADRERKS